MAINSTPLQKGQVLAGKYQVSKPIAAGGYALVYSAERIDDGHNVVIKALREEAFNIDPSAVDRFIREAAVATHLDHPNIVKLLDFGQTRDKVLYIVMEHLHGAPLSDLMFHGPSTPALVENVLKQVLDALSYAHGRGVVHRDIKPSNIFLCRRDALKPGEVLGEKDLIQLLDLGFAKVLKSNDPTFSRPLTVAGQQVGTPGYMAPELLRNTGNVSPLIDLYAVGIIGYELLTGQPAFAGRGIQRALAQVNTVPEKPKDDVCNYPIYSVVKRLMARNPSRRYSSAADALRAIEGLSDDPRNRSWSPFRRNKP